jgi:hypothetical protein
LFIIIQLQSSVHRDEAKSDSIFFFISHQKSGIFSTNLSKYIFVFLFVLNDINKIIVKIIHIIISLKFVCKKFDALITRVVSAGRLTFAHLYISCIFGITKTINTSIIAVDRVIITDG